MAVLLRDPTGGEYGQVELELQDRILSVYGNRDDGQLFRYKSVLDIIFKAPQNEKKKSVIHRIPREFGITFSLFGKMHVQGTITITFKNSFNSSLEYVRLVKNIFAHDFLFMKLSY